MEQFRKLKANEIEVRIGQVNKGGVSLVLYKDARVDQNILDETFGIFGWKRTHQLIGDNLYCTVQVKNPDTGEWVEKQDVGTESYTEKEKGQASDSFKRACFNFGIGRELYTTPSIFFPKDKLANYKDGEKPSCYDKFKVKSISYTQDGIISQVTIECINYGKVHSSLTFNNNTNIVELPTGKESSPARQTHTQAKSGTVSKTSVSANDTIKDDEVIRIGNCRGQKYGEVKNSEAFSSFLNWVKTASGGYNDPVQQRQYIIFKKMSQQKGA